MNTERLAGSRRFAIGLSVCVAVLSSIPFLWGVLSTPKNAWYPGIQFNTDDHMVYVAWASQAAEGRLLMDNRFAVDSQPGLTVNLYFLVLGWLSKLVGLEWAFAIVRAALSAALTMLLYGAIGRLLDRAAFVKLALTLCVFAGGLGFLVWHTFGDAITRPTPEPLRAALLGRLPMDVWQPEAYAFPSMLVNGLFVWALCLILLLFRAILEARESWKPVPLGALAAFLLMNTHSYDVLLVGLVLVAFLVATGWTRQLTIPWLLRAIVVFSGALPAALWFLYVLSNDPVFQARAATETYSPNFRQIVAGLAPLIVLALTGFAVRAHRDDARARRVAALFGAATMIVVGWIASADHSSGYWLGWTAWSVCFVSACGLSAALSTSNPALNLVQCWAFVGVVAPYIPFLFQRKLAMGLAVPWALLAALGVYALLKKRDASTRRAAFALATVLLCASSVRWLAREIEFIRSNVARTTVHPVFYSQEVRDILTRLRDLPGRKVVLAMPGWPAPLSNQEGPIPDAFGPPLVPDLNSLASGYGLAYTFAGHWSETPDYLPRRALATSFFLSRSTPAQRLRWLVQIGATHILAPMPEAYPHLRDERGPILADVRELGTVVAGGTEFALIEVTPDLGSAALQAPK